MGYIEELRKLAGHRPILLVGAGVLVTDPAGRLLLGLRTDNHQWGLPGGATELGETVEATARREMIEETGLEADELTLFEVFSGPEFFYTYPNGDQVHNISVVYTCGAYHGALKGDGEHKTFRFFAPDELPEAISPPVRPVIRRWLEKTQK